MKIGNRLFVPVMLGLSLLTIAGVRLFNREGPNSRSTGVNQVPAPLPSETPVNEHTIHLGNAARIGPDGDKTAARAVSVGGSAQSDACDRTGKIAHLDPAADNFLAVRAAPEAGAEETDRLYAGADVYICEGAGAWTGIVYGPGGTLEAGCGVTRPIEQRTSYIGSCRSGWVSRKHIELVAG